MPAPTTSEIQTASHDQRSLTRVFRRGFGIVLGFDFVARILGAITVVILVRSLSVSNYAFLTLFLVLAQLVGSAASGGVRTRYLREEAERISRDVPAPRGSFTAALTASLFLTLAFGLAVLPIAASIGLGHHAGGDIALLLYALGYALCWSGIELSIAHYQARRRFLSSGVLNVVRASAVTTAALVVAVTSPHLPVLPLCFIGLLSIVAVLTIGAPLRESGLHISRFRRAVGFTAEEGWLSIYYLAAAGFAYVDVLVVSALLHERQIATLGASLRYLAVVLGALPALGAILRVRTSQIDVIDSGSAQREMAEAWVKRTIAPIGVCIGIVIALAPFVIPLVDGGRYPGSIVVFQIYVVIAFAAYVLAPGSSILMAQRRYAFLATSYLFALSFNLAGDVVVARRYGLTGIAVVSTSAFVLLSIAMFISALREAQARAGFAVSVVVPRDGGVR